MDWEVLLLGALAFLGFLLRWLRLRRRDSSGYDSEESTSELSDY
jgi:hypothetical protein